MKSCLVYVETLEGLIVVGQLAGCTGIILRARCGIVDVGLAVRLVGIEQCASLTLSSASTSAQHR